MKVSLNTIKQFIDFELPPVTELVERINQQLGGVEEVIDLAAKYKGIVIAKVVTCQPHPDSDHLHVCTIDPGDALLPSSIQRLPSNYIQVVCGAPNVRAGMFVAWLPPGSTVPASYDKDPSVLDVRKLRGIESNGMLASAAELAIGDNHEGILEIDPAEWKPTDQKIVPGADFAEVFGLDDTIIDIENKMFTHRPDCFGQLGVAREIAGILGHEFKSPDWYLRAPEFKLADQLQLTVFNEAEEKVPRFMAVAIKGVSIQPSPLWLQCALVALGSKPINNIVDVTNYVMLLTAQPLHAYDYDKLRGQTLGVRMGKPGEKLPLLNGKTYDVTPDDIVIVDGEGPVGMGGIMGGGNSEVSAATKNIVLECATFDMYTIRKTSMRHGLFTDAVTRFNKGQSPLQNPMCLQLAMQSVFDTAGGDQASDVFDLHSKLRGQPVMTVETQFVNDRLGLRLSGSEIAKMLQCVEFDLVDDQQVIDSRIDELAVPFWRTDIQLPEDIVEEVGRLYGFDKLPRELPLRSMKPAPKNQSIEMKRNIRDILSGAGANEVLTYSFVHEKVLKQAGQNPDHAYKLSNALSPDLQYYRLSVTPSLLDKVHMNIKAGHGSFALFEIGKSHFKGEFDAADQNVPNEDTHVGCVVAALDKLSPEGALYYLAKRYLEKIVDPTLYSLQKLADFNLTSDEWGAQLTAPYDPNRSAVLVRDGQIWGVVGEFKQSVQRAFKLPTSSAGFEVHIELATHKRAAYAPLSRFPSVSQDVSLRVAPTVPYGELFSTAQAALAQLESRELRLTLTPLGVYQPENAQTKTITLRLRATNYQRTLTDAEVTGYLDNIAASVAEKVQAVKV